MMTGQLSFFGRLMKVIIPTRVQVLAVMFLSMGILILIEITAIIHRLGISDAALVSSQSQIQDRFSVVSHSIVASNIALVAFWSTIGLIAYLICWAGYNLLIEARNEVTLETQYKNLGHTHGPWLTLAIKAVASVLLIVVIATFRYGFALAVAMVAPLIQEPGITTVLSGIAAVAILALDMYLVFVCVELVLSSWYRSEAFTE